MNVWTYRAGNAAEKLAVIRHMALNLLRAAKDAGTKFDKAQPGQETG